MLGVNGMRTAGRRSLQQSRTRISVPKHGLEPRGWRRQAVSVRPKSTWRQAAGFSLIELRIVISIISLLAALASPV